MKKILFMILLFASARSFAQKPKDTLIYNLPTVNDQLIYQGTGKVSNHERPTLDSLAKAWFYDYFKANNLNPDSTLNVSPTNDTTTIKLNRGILEYKVRPGMINIAFVAFINIKISVTNNSYSYQIDHIFFRPKNGTLNSIGYQNDPEYLIKAYKKKHLGLAIALNVDRKQIREYLSTINTAVRNCIGSLNNAMTK